MEETIKLNGVYNFNTIAPNILKARFENMKAIALLNYEQARKYRDVAVLHEMIKGTVSTTLPLNVKDCSFICFESPDKTTTILALEYLINIESVNISTLVININNYTANDYSVIKSALEDLGYRNITFEIKPVNS